MMDGLTPPLDAEAGAHLIEAAGTEAFGALLLELARAIGQIDELFGYMVLDGQEPETMVSSSVLLGCDDRVMQYVQRFYQHDPAVHEIRQIPVGDSFVQRIGLTSIIPHDYRQHCFSDPGFAEKFSFGWRGNGYLFVLSFYRREAADETVLRKLANLANLAIAIMVRHHAPINRSNVLEVLERRFARSFPEMSQREREVCARTLAGHTAAATAEEFGISPGTVLTYRQRAYQRYGVSSAAEFLPLLLN